MQVITIEQARAKARELQQMGQEWHFHVLFPGCVFNTQIHQYAFVLEDRSSDRTYVTYSDQGFAEISQELLKLHYGENILKTPVSGSLRSDPASDLLIQCREFQRNHIAWHHHMLFPDCILNQHHGKWNLVLESGEAGMNINEVYEVEPLDVLRELEIGYFERDLPDR
jgi:hypothetical protein